MSARTHGAARTSRGGGSDIAVFGVVAAVIVAVVWLVAGGTERAPSRAATGFDGLVAWLRANDVEARTFRGGGQMVRGEIGLRILPLFDTDLDEPRARPETREEVIAQTSETDLTRYVVRAKMRRLPTLVILPKWRTGMRRLGVAHRDLLIPEDEIDRLLGQVFAPLGRVGRDAGGWREIAGAEGPISLHHAQTVAPGPCAPLIQAGAGRMILGRCPLRAGEDEESAFWLLADPDLAANHGLAWARNGAEMLAFVRRLDDGLPVIVDLSDDVYTIDRDWRADNYERSWEDTLRMFRWPFAMIWIAFGALGALVLWRAVTRDGPLARAEADEPRAAKEVSIEAKARLLRLADHDAALLESHVRGRLAHLAAEVLGPHRAPDRLALDVLTRLIGRRDPALARDLAEAAAPPDTDRPAQAEILRRLDRFETCYDKVMHEFGRSERTG